MLNLEQMARLENYASVFARMDNSLVIARSAGNLHPSIAGEPFKLNGLTITLIEKGTLEIDLDDNSYTAEGPALLVLDPVVTARMSSDRWEDVEIFSLFCTSDFLNGLNVNLSALHLPDLAEKPARTLPLSEADTHLMQSYFNLLLLALRSFTGTPIDHHIASSLVASVLYLVVQLHYKSLNVESIVRPAATGPRPKRTSYVRDFLRLVHVDYVRHRDLEYYAKRLCISQKYLSVLVKNATGKTASRWIDDFVIMEAKNLLRYSDKNVQQVAYALNFVNQSAFGKYFKHLTGMSPSQYQKSAK